VNAGRPRVAGLPRLRWWTYQTHRGGERFRLRTSRQVKRAEETSDDLVNHPLEQKYKRRQQRARSRCLTGSRAVSLRVLPLQDLASLGGLPPTAAAVVGGTSNSSYDLAGRPV
jgi:hypothetical protein